MEKFIELQTVRNEKVSVNVNRVLFFAETKKSTSVVLDDGTSIDVSDDYASLKVYEFLRFLNISDVVLFKFLAMRVHPEYINPFIAIVRIVPC